MAGDTAGLDGCQAPSVAYFAIVPHVLDRDEAPRRIARGAPRQIPSILLTKLALSENLHGQGLGAELLIHALRAIVDAARVAGGKPVVVDAIDAGQHASTGITISSPRPTEPTGSS